MSKKEIKNIIISAPCRDIGAEELLNRIIFDFNSVVEKDAISATTELGSRDIWYFLEVSIRTNCIDAFVEYLRLYAPDASTSLKGVIDKTEE